MAVTLDTAPGTSLCEIISVGYSPVNSTTLPFTSVILILPPPIDDPTISWKTPSISSIINLTVLGCASPKSTSLNSISIFFSYAISKEFLSFVS